MAYPESLVHQLDSILLAHVRVVPLPEQRPRQHLPKSCNARPYHDNRIPRRMQLNRVRCKVYHAQPGRLRKPQRAQITVQMLAIEYPCLGKESCIMHHWSHRVGDLSVGSLPVAMCSSEKWTPSMLIVPRKGFSS